MKPLRPWQSILVAAFTLALALIGWRLLSGPPKDADAPVGTALVTLAPIESASIDETVTAYGVVAGSPGASRTIAAPRGVIIERLLVAPGQTVQAGAPLVVFSNTPASELAARQAEDAVNFALQDLERVQRLFDAHLAASDQLNAARKVLADAQATAAAQHQSGAGSGHQTLTAPFAGTVATVQATLGEHVAADAPLMTLIADGGLVAQLNIEPAKARMVAPGQAVRLASAFDNAQSMLSRVTVVGHLVDPVTRLITVSAPIEGAGLPLGGSVRGEIAVAHHQGLRAPRAALVYDEAGAHVFVIKAGKAHLAAVTPGAESGDEIEISGDVHAGDSVAVTGAYQLQDGWPVRTAGR